MSAMVNLAQAGSAHDRPAARPTPARGDSAA